MPDYEKNMDCYLKCADKILDALANAEKITDYFEDAPWPSIECNPRTDMGELIRELEF